MPSKTMFFAVCFACSILAALAADKVQSRYPDGTGDPDATTCRPPQSLPASRMLGPEVCKLNSEWAVLRKNAKDISADGTQIIPDPRGRSMAPMNCTVAGGGASNGGGAMTCR